MSADAFVFDSDQLDAAARAFVQQGPAGTRALRQQEVDGAMNFLKSDAARKLRVQSKPPVQHEPARTVLGIERERAGG